MIIPSFIEARLRTAVAINGIDLSLKVVPTALRRFCTPAFFHYDDPVLDLSKYGSALRIRYRDRNLVLLTQHQLGHGPGRLRPEQFTVALIGSDGRKVGLSPNVVSRPRVETIPHRNLEDLLILGYEDTRNGRDLRSLFLNIDLETTLETVNPETIEASFAIGYPTCGDTNDVKFDEDYQPTSFDMEMRWAQLYLKLDEAAPMDTENRRAMVPDPKAGQVMLVPDGMSGAPVFFVSVVASIPRLGFAGMITDARPDRYMVYDGAMIRRMLDGFLNCPDPMV